MGIARHPALRLVRRYVLLPIATVLEAGVHGVEWLFPRGPDEIWTSTMAFDVDVDTTDQGAPAVIFMTTEKNDGTSLQAHANRVTLRLGGLGVLILLVIAYFSREPSVPITLMVLWMMALSLILAFFFNRSACRWRKPMMLRKGYAEVRLDADGTIEFWASPKDFTGQTGHSMPYTPAITFVVGTYRQLLGSRPTDAGAAPTDEHDPWVVIAQDGLGTAVPVAIHSGSQADMVRLHTALTEQFAARYEANIRAMGKLLKAEQENEDRRQDQRLHDRRREMIGVPLAHGDHRFVPLEAAQHSDEPFPVECLGPAQPDESWNVPDPRITRNRFAWQRGAIEFSDLVRRDGVLFRVVKSVSFILARSPDRRHPHDGMIEFSMFAESAIRQAYRPHGELKDVRVLSGADITIPPDYLPFPDVAVDGATRVLCAEFTDGALLPLTQSVTELALDFDKVRAAMLELAGAGGEKPSPPRRNIKL